MLRERKHLPYTTLAFLFHVEMPMSYGTCLIHEGSKIPGRGSKNCILTREFSRCSERQYNITQGLERNFLKNIFSNGLRFMRQKGDRSLSIFEYQNLQENLEHNGMVTRNYDRQTHIFSDADTANDGGFNYTYDAKNRLVDEIKFLSCPLTWIISIFTKDTTGN